jgi:hypothetical protein
MQFFSKNSLKILCAGALALNNHDKNGMKLSCNKAVTLYWNHVCPFPASKSWSVVNKVREIFIYPLTIFLLMQISALMG